MAADRLADTPLAEVVKPCAKCGSDDLLVRWHDDAPQGWPSSCHKASGRIYYRGPSSPDEHLHYHCRRCQYDWIGATADSGAAQGGSQ